MQPPRMATRVAPLREIPGDPSLIGDPRELSLKSTVKMFHHTVRLLVEESGPGFSDSQELAHL